MKFDRCHHDSREQTAERGAKATFLGVVDRHSHRVPHPTVSVSQFRLRRKAFHGAVSGDERLAGRRRQPGPADLSMLPVNATGQPCQPMH